MIHTIISWFKIENYQAVPGLIQRFHKYEFYFILFLAQEGPDPPTQVFSSPPGRIFRKINSSSSYINIIALN